MERRLTAILAADVVGYSRLVGADEEGTLAALKSLRSQIIEPLIDEHHGRVVKLMGDGFLVEFQSAVDAAKCAVEWQRKLEEQEDQAALSFRIGVNAGDIVIDGDDILGDGVNIAARLEASGAPGHVVISDVVYHQIDGKLDATFCDNGTIRLKNIAQPVRVWSWPKPLQHLTSSTQAGRRPGIHVAQFEPRGSDAEELADAIHDDLTTTFANQSGIRLITDPDTSDFFVRGTVHGRKNRWRISASLVDQINGQIVWSERLEEIGEDIFEIQDRCVTRISGAVRIRLPSIVGSRLVNLSLEEMNIQDLLNYAMNCAFVPTIASWNNAVPALQLALERDNKNWMAMTMLCFNIFTKVRIFDWRKVKEADAQFARELIERAHALKPDSEVVRAVHGAFFLYAERNTEAARIEVEESLQLNPNFYHSIDVMSQIELFCDNVSKAKDLAIRAADCDPGYPYLHLYHRSLGYVHLVDGDYLAAIDLFERANRAAPGLPQNLIAIIVSAQLNEDYGKAETAAKTLLRLVPDFVLDEYEPWPFSQRATWMPIHDALATAITK